MSAWVYVLRCRDGSLYTGWTNQLEKRVKTHQAGKGGKYTRSRLPVRLVGAWRKRTRREAMREEVLFKQCTRLEKLKKLRKCFRTKTPARVRPRARVSVRLSTLFLVCLAGWLGVARCLGGFFLLGIESAIAV